MRNYKGKSRKPDPRDNYNGKIGKYHTVNSKKIVFGVKKAVHAPLRGKSGRLERMIQKK